MDWYELLPKILNMSLTASVISVTVIILRLLLKRAPKVYSYMLWLVVLFRLLCPITINTPLSVLGLFDPPIVETTDSVSQVAYIPNNIVHTENPEVTLPVPVLDNAINNALPQGAEQLVADPLEAPVSIATYIWLAGIVAMIGVSMISYVKLRKSLVGAVRVRGNIYVADYITTPFVLGIFRPRIYLLSSLSEQEQEYILKHEQYHIRRGDHIFKLLAYVALCIHWFNPLVWLAFLLFSKDMEMSCDEAVVKKLGEDVRADYSASLLNLATDNAIMFGMPLAFGEVDTKGRIKNLAAWKKPTFWVTIGAILICIVGIVICISNVSNVELIKCCEKYFDEYICRYRKIKELRTIEYVNLAGVHRELWYKKAAHFMKIFVALSIFVTIFSMFFGISYKPFGVIGLIIIFGILVITER